MAACARGGKICDILFMCDVKLMYIYIKNSSGEMENAWCDSRKDCYISAFHSKLTVRMK